MTITILIDTREQDNEKLQNRIEAFKALKCDIRREKLNYGDYSAEYINEDGQVISFTDRVVIERKMNLDELCNCYTKDRERFKREFERAKENGCKLYLLIENGSLDKIIGGKYRSNLNPASLIASLLAWSVRYGFSIYFCQPENSAEIIYKILHYEIKEYLKG